MRILGERIKELRQEAKLTQEELGEGVFVTKVSICCYENNIREPGIETLVQIADIFDVSIDYLVGRTNQR